MNEFGKAIAARFDADEFNPGWCVGSPVSHVLELFAMDEMEAIRKALRGMAQKICDEWGGEADSVLVEGDAWDIAGRTTHKWSLPPSVVAWVMED